MTNFFWPGNSADFNPIKNVWAMLKAGVFNFIRKPKKKNELKNFLKRQWKKDEINGKHKKLIDSFGKRLEELKKKNFQKIDY